MAYVCDKLLQTLKIIFMICDNIYNITIGENKPQIQSYKYNQLYKNRHLQKDWKRMHCNYYCYFIFKNSGNTKGVGNYPLIL